MQKNEKAAKRAAVIGSGISGLAVALRLKKRGYDVTIYEKNDYIGGKIAQFTHAGYRFDMGPSLFTLPELLTELFELYNEKAEMHFKYLKLEKVCRYFYPDATVLDSFSDVDKMAAELHLKVCEAPARLIKYLKGARQLYKITAEVFLFSPLRLRLLMKKKAFWYALPRAYKLKSWITMHRFNNQSFTSPHTVQLFDRYATYNGSSPYKAPATLNVISHLEHNEGAFFPARGMYSIVEALVNLAHRQGINILTNSRVDKIIEHNGRATALQVAKKQFDYDLIVSAIDMHFTYKNLLPDLNGEKYMREEKSSSALVFYWSMNRQYAELDLHNIFFTTDYQAEFIHLFDKKELYNDPTIYVFVSSKQVPEDAPKGCENWFVMINAPENTGQYSSQKVSEMREIILTKLEKMLQTSISQHIVHERISDPQEIENRTASYHGALYGNSSNSQFAAFRRHPNQSRQLKNLFFTGGSVHPGGGIPLCLASAKIVDKLLNY